MEAEFTANHYLAWPRVETSAPALASANVLHAGLDGLVEWSAGEDDRALIVPRLSVAGTPILLTGAVWDRVDRWLPRFRAMGADLVVTGTLCPLAGHDARARGAVWILDLENRGGERSVDVAFEGVWRWSRLLITGARPLFEPNRLARAGTSGLALEAGPPGRGAALALLLAGRSVEHQASPGDAPLAPMEPGAVLEAPNGTPLRYALRRAIRLPAGGRNRCALFVGVAPERDGALAAAAGAAAIGAEAVLRDMRLELARVTRSAEGPEAELATRNLLYAHFCAVARAVDDDRLYPVRSRSPLHERPGTVDERETLEWTIPLLLTTDRALARETFERMMEQYSDRPGHATRYIGGGVLAPGFALDRACALVLALDRYVAVTGDHAMLDEPLVQTVVRETDELLWHRLHPDIFLASTDVLPSGERPDHPWVAFDNALLRAVCEAIDRCARGEPPPLLGGRAEELSAAFWQRLTTDYGGARIIACSSDLKGEAAVYDDPRGSLALLPSLGFCDDDDPIWENTLELLRSRAYPFWLGERPYPGLAGRGAPGEASMAALCADLRTPRRAAALDVLRRLTLDGGIAAETWDPDSGRAVSGRFAAALAALLATTLRDEPAHAGTAHA